MYVQEWYGDRVGVMYILYTNYLFWILYTILIRPFMLLWSKDNNLIFVDTSEGKQRELHVNFPSFNYLQHSDLLKYFNADQLFLLR